jgi:fructokinase
VSPPHVSVGGEALVDLVVALDGSITPKLGGGPYNVARALGRLGVQAQFIASISTDRFGEQLLQGLVDDGVGIDMVSRTDAPTTLAVAQLSADGSAEYTFYLQGTSAPDLREAPSDDHPDAVHVGTLGLVLQPMADTLEHYLHGLAPTTLVMLDPNCRPSVPVEREHYGARLQRIAGLAHVVKISADDAEFLEPGAQPRAVARDLVAAGAMVVLLTQGAAGTEVITAAGERRVPSVPVAVADTIGAGDSFGAAFLAAWLSSGRGIADLVDLDALQRATEAANQVAAITCSRVGADPPHRDELPADWGS